MNHLVTTSCAVAALAAAGCSSSPSAAAAREPYVKPGLIMVTADQARRLGVEVEGASRAPEPPMPAELSRLDSAAIVAPPDVKVYSLNRSVDPADRELMHEAHVVYRRETSPRWRLDAPADQKILVGPRVTDGRQELQPMLNNEVTAFLAEQRRVAEANQKAIASLFEAVEALNRQQQSILRRELTPARKPASAPTEPERDAAKPPAGDERG